MHERTLKTKWIYKGRIVSLRNETVKVSNGVISQREIVGHPGAAAIIAITNDNKILLIRQFRKSANRVLLEIPAGLVHKGESWISGAKRELLEETGYKAKKIRPLFQGYSSPGYSTEIIRFFIATDLVKAQQNTDEDEIISVAPYSIKKCLEMVKKGIIKDNKTMIGILAANIWKKQ